MTTLDVSVIICTCADGRWNDLCAAVASMHDQTKLPREIIVVVDHNPGLFARVQAEMPDVVPLQNAEVRGLSGGRNTGILRAAGALLAFVDDDAVAEPNWLELLDASFSDPDILGAGGLVAPLWLCYPPAWFPHEFSWVIGCTYLPSPPHPIAVRNPYGGCTCIRREVFAAVGGFRNGIGRADKRPLGCEETELCIRAHKYWPNRMFLWQPAAVMHHRVTPERATWRYFWSRCYAEGLSKAAISAYVGAKDSLASERSYTLQILPRGLLSGLRDGVLRGDLSGFLRAFAIISGLCTTAAGYLVGFASHWLQTGGNVSIAGGVESIPVPTGE
jgi:glucosyl-dolichyl phosphate glucuronosyltransferase